MSPSSSSSSATRKPSTRKPGSGRGRGGRTAAQIADTERRDDIGYALKLSGEYSLQRIADYPDPERPGETLYGSKKAAADGWRRACERHAAGDVSMKDRRALYEQRYETLLRVVWPDAMRRGRGYLHAVDRAVSIMGELRGMLGVDVPTQVDVNLTVDTDFDRAYRELHDELAAHAAGGEVAPEPARAALEDGLGDPNE